MQGGWVGSASLIAACCFPVLCPVQCSIINECKDLRKNKSVSVNPLGILGVECHEFVEQDVGHWGHAHRGAGVAGVGLESGIDLYEKDARLSVGVSKYQSRYLWWDCVQKDDEGGAVPNIPQADGSY